MTPHELRQLVLEDPRVALADCGGYDERVPAALWRLAKELGWADGSTVFGNVIRPGAKVLVKPNMVLHANELRGGRGGFEELVTHGSVVKAVVEAALASGAGQVQIGDAPLQSCDFPVLLERMGLTAWDAELKRREPRYAGIQDFRRTVCVVRAGVRSAVEDLQPLDNFRLFDLGRDSLLEPVSEHGDHFRVCWYDPRLMWRTHGKGLHQYLVARQIVDADVVINVPKMKTHKKAGVTCALKNLIGINGNKEYLPHHRIGGSGQGGDCYPGVNVVKRWLEKIADRQNMTDSRFVAALCSFLTLCLTRITRLQGDRFGIEGSWSGNDTIWRTCLDLNRILLYGRPDGTLADQPQRRVIHIADAVLAGHGEGPLSPLPLPMKLLVGSQNPAAMDFVAADLLGYDWTKLPIVRGAFESFHRPVVAFAPEQVRVVGPVDVESRRPESISYPPGWVSAVAAGKKPGAALVAQ